MGDCSIAGLFGAGVVSLSAEVPGFGQQSVKVGKKPVVG